MKKLYTLGFALVMGLLISAAPARAESFNFDAVGKNPPPSTNKFHVAISRIGNSNSFGVTIKRDWQNQKTGLNPIRGITISFYCCQDQGQIPFDDTKIVNVASGTGGTNTNTAETTFNSWGPASNGANAGFNTADVNKKLLGAGNNSNTNQVRDLFKGLVTLSTNQRVAGVSVVMIDSNQSWQGSAVDPTAPDCVPEPNALALMFPGILPLCLLLRGRFSRAKKQEEA